MRCLSNDQAAIDVRAVNHALLAVAASVGVVSLRHERATGNGACRSLYEPVGNGAMTTVPVAFGCSSANATSRRAQAGATVT